MANALTIKGQVTIPKRVRDALGLKPGDGIDFIIGDTGEVVVRPAQRPARSARTPDRFERARGKATYKLGSTEAYMKFIRGDDYGEDEGA